MKKVFIIIPVFLSMGIFSFCQPNKIHPANKDNVFDNGSNIVFPQLNELKIENLVLLGELWGFLKYNHPKIGEGDYNWDYELFRILPKYLKVINKTQRDNVLLKWINSYGDIPVCNSCKITPPNAYLKPYAIHNLKW